MRTRLATAAALLLAFGGALALAAHDWPWAWLALVVAALAAGMFEWARLLGLGRAWGVAYVSLWPLLISYFLMCPDVLGICQGLKPLLVVLPLFPGSFFYLLTWLVITLVGAVWFSRSQEGRRVVCAVWGLGGLLLIPAVAFPMIIMVREWSMLLFLLLTVVATDSVAFLAGQRFGNRLLAPRISPGKTWFGLWAGLAAAGVAGIFLPLLLSFADTPRVHWDRVGLEDGLLLGLAIGLCAVVGDLAISVLKRSAGVKDSGRLLPGHGGVLDRIDGFLLAGPAFMWMSFVAWPTFFWS